MELQETAQQLVRIGKGILAADESTPTVGKRLAKHGLQNTEVDPRASKQREGDNGKQQKTILRFWSRMYVEITVSSF